MRWLLLSLVLVGCGPQVGREPTTVIPGRVIAQKSRVPDTFHLWRFNAPVIPVQVENGALEPPNDPLVLGWWGKPAGARHGTTLIVGHSVHTGGGELQTLANTPIGATARVSGIRYRVTRVFTVSKTKFAQQSASLLRQTGPHRLVVVSCAHYNWSTGIWPDNAVVVANPI